MKTLAQTWAHGRTREQLYLDVKVTSSTFNTKCYIEAQHQIFFRNSQEKGAMSIISHLSREQLSFIASACIYSGNLSKKRQVFRFCKLWEVVKPFKSSFGLKSFPLNRCERLSVKKIAAKLSIDQFSCH